MGITRGITGNNNRKSLTAEIKMPNMARKIKPPT